MLANSKSESKLQFFSWMFFLRMLLNICCYVYYCCLTLTRWWNLFTHKWWMFNCSTSFFCRNTLTKSMIFKTQISISYLYIILFRHASNPEKSLSKFTSTIKVLQKCKEVHSIIYHGLHYWFLKLNLIIFRLKHTYPKLYSCYYW